MYGYKHLQRGDLNENNIAILSRGTSHAWLQTACMKAIFTKMVILMDETTRAWLQHFDWDDLDEDGNFRNGQLITHGPGYIIFHGGDLNGQ